ncbi:MAG TPA: hypothetical protein VEQ17_05820 [Steroidobacteraceae bacterium]|nr:hypothetical protein [Steroidobacteraceae bacterium]
MRRVLFMFLVIGAAAACTRKPETDKDQAATPAAPPPAAAAGCADGFLKARLRGALDTDLDWRDAGMRCEGGPRPGGKGLRVTLAGPIPGSGEPARQLRFIFGIATRDIAAGAAQALPTNVTIILEGGGQMYATRGDGHCAVEELERSPLPGDASRQRVHVRGYCLDPAGAMSGDGRLHVPTFEFSGVVDAGEKP